MAISPPIIAVVDDDAAVRNSLRFSLELEGFLVRTYVSAADLLESDLTSLRCLIVDEDMPQMTGLELVAKLRAQGMMIPALLMSGRLTPAIMRRASVAGVVLIEKPFLGNGLIESIRAAVGTKPG
jgi:two-component system, LuxR family, response regulator FixJ